MPLPSVCALVLIPSRSLRARTHTDGTGAPPLARVTEPEMPPPGASEKSMPDTGLPAFTVTIVPVCGWHSLKSSHGIPL